MTFWERSWKRRAGRVAAFGAYLAAGGYLAALVLLLYFENQLLYTPGDAAQWSPPPSGLEVRDEERSFTCVLRLPIAANLTSQA